MVGQESVANEMAFFQHAWRPTKHNMTPGCGNEAWLPCARVILSRAVPSSRREQTPKRKSPLSDASLFSVSFPRRSSARSCDILTQLRISYVHGSMPFCYLYRLKDEFPCHHQPDHAVWLQQYDFCTLNVSRRVMSSDRREVNCSTTPSPTPLPDPHKITHAMQCGCNSQRSRCYPLQLNEMGMHEGKECFYSGRPATHMAIFARAF